MTADGGCERDVVHRMNDGYRAWGALKSVLSSRGLGIKAKKCLYEGVIVPTTLYGAETWGMRSAERRKVNVLEMKCLRSLVGLLRMDRVRNQEVRRRAGIVMESASRADQKVLRMFGHVERMDDYRMVRTVLFLCSFLNCCGCSTAKSKTPPQETIFFTHLPVQSLGLNHP